MAKRVIEEYWCDHCGVVASKECALDLGVSRTLHFCPDCIRKVFVTQLDHVPAEQRAKFINYYHNKGLPSDAR